MGFEGFPQTSRNITLMSLAVAVMATILCLTLGKNRGLRDVRFPIFIVLAVGLAISVLDYHSYTATTNGIALWAAIGPSLLVTGLYGSLMVVIRPRMTLKKALGLFILLSPLIAGIIWGFAYEFIAVHNY